MLKITLSVFLFPCLIHFILLVKQVAHVREHCLQRIKPKPPGENAVLQPKLDGQVEVAGRIAVEKDSKAVRRSTFE